MQTDEQVATRLEGAHRELSFLASNPGFFDFVVTNHELDGAFEQMRAQLATWYPHTLPSNP
jgi:guanylate kinase